MSEQERKLTGVKGLSEMFKSCKISTWPAFINTETVAENLRPEAECFEKAQEIANAALKESKVRNQIREAKREADKIVRIKVITVCVIGMLAIIAYKSLFK